MGFLQNLFGPKTDLAELAKNGATIIDVRTKAEYSGGHITNSLNIPLDRLESHIAKLKKDQAIITCCASGIRSASARAILKSHGFTNVHNGGGWMSLQNKLNR